MDERESAGGVAVMRYVELFAGAGGLSLGLEAAGMECVAHAELEPHARAVLRKHWPDTPLHGDVSAVDWTQYAGRVDLVSGGSPCQDLSVAGKRAGLEGARSGLFFELIRAWDETGAPYCLWENVDGARSSNAGADFASVLSTLVGAAVAVPARWASAGVAAGPTGVAAWRVLDLQHFGPPQRRRRVFVLAARAGGCDPAEILAVSESVCGHPAPRERTGQGTARGVAGGVGTVGWDNELNAAHELSGPLMARANAGGDRNGVLAFDTTQVTSSLNYSNPKPGDPCHPLAAGAHPPAVIAFQPGNLSRRAGADPSTDTFPTLGAYTNGDQAPHVLAFHHTQDPISGAVSPFLGATTDGMGVLCTTGHVTHALASEGCDAIEDGTGRGTPIVTPTLNMGAHTAAPGSNGQDALEWAAITVPLVGRPRRLTPLECERLMSWPDQWTAHGVKEDGIEYALSDTARYRLCGNGVGSVVAEWIARRLVWAEANNPIAAPGRTETR